MNRERALNSKRYKLLLYHRYFETGRSKLSYVQYLIAFYALASSDVLYTLLYGTIYAVSCFIIGVLWYKSNTVLIEGELGNQFNLFVKEMRRSQKL